MEAEKRDIEGLFLNRSSVEDKIFTNYDEIRELAETCRLRGKKIVLTSGTFDLMHIGHARYLDRAGKEGDFLIVGVDSDEKTRARKGEHRPVVPEDERMEVVCHHRAVGAVFLKELRAEKWKLIKTVRPDTLIIVRRTYEDPENIKALEEICGRLVVLEYQATTSTSAKIRKVMTEPLDRLRRRLKEAVGGVFDLLDKLTGEDGSG